MRLRKSPRSRNTSHALSGRRRSNYTRSATGAEPRAYSLPDAKEVPRLSAGSAWHQLRLVWQFNWKTAKSDVGCHTVLLTLVGRASAELTELEPQLSIHKLADDEPRREALPDPERGAVRAPPVRLERAVADLGVIDEPAAAVVGGLHHRAVDSSGVVVYDGSGLSRHNLVTPETLVKTLVAMMRVGQTALAPTMGDRFLKIDLCDPEVAAGEIARRIARLRTNGRDDIC